MTPDGWEADFNRDGQVVLPLRPGSQIWRLGLVAFLAGIQALQLVFDVSNFATGTWTWHWNFWVIGHLVALVLLALIALLLLTQMSRRLPAVTISKRGVQNGQRIVSWDQVRGIEHRSDGRVMLLTDSRPLRIDKAHTDNAHALAWWLQSLLERARVR